MTTTHFQVDPAQVRAHAGTVGDIAGGLSTVAGGLPCGLAEGVLGTFVQFLTAGLADAMSQVTDAVALASSALDDTSTSLTRTAAHYQDTDDHNAAGLRWEEVR
jgi:hypothetical protein